MRRLFLLLLKCRLFRLVSCGFSLRRSDLYWVIRALSSKSPSTLPQTPKTKDSISHSLVPRRIRKWPFSPQSEPQELAQICKRTDNYFVLIYSPVFIQRDLNVINMTCIGFIKKTCILWSIIIMLLNSVVVIVAATLSAVCLQQWQTKTDVRRKCYLPSSPQSLFQFFLGPT